MDSKNQLYRQKALDSMSRSENGSDPIRGIEFNRRLPIVASILFILALIGFAMLIFLWPK